MFNFLIVRYKLLKALVFNLNAKTYLIPFLFTLHFPTFTHVLVNLETNILVAHIKTLSLSFKVFSYGSITLGSMIVIRQALASYFGEVPIIPLESISTTIKTIPDYCNNPWLELSKVEEECCALEFQHFKLSEKVKERWISLEDFQQQRLLQTNSVLLQYLGWDCKVDTTDFFNKKNDVLGLKKEHSVDYINQINRELYLLRRFEIDCQSVDRWCKDEANVTFRINLFSALIIGVFMVNLAVIFNQ